MMNMRICRYFCAFMAVLLVLSCAACERSVVPTQTTSTQPTSTQPSLTTPTTQGQHPDHNGAMIYVDEDVYFASFVGVGNHEIALEEEMNYVLFVPLEAGEYRFSLPGFDAEIGYYGRADFVRRESLVEVVDNTVTVTVRDGMINKDAPNSSAFVIGIRTYAAQEACTLRVERIGNPAWDVSDEPWFVYEPTVELTPYSLPDGVKLEEFDLTAPADAYELVFNETDGFYHLGSADGPLVLVYLKKGTAYLDEIFTVANLSNLCRYFYDGEGNFIRRETYNQCILTYAQHADKKAGVYPLTKDLQYMIQSHGEFTGWWDMDDPYNCLFRDEDGNILQDINPELAWLFLCCYLN